MRPPCQLAGASTPGTSSVVSTIRSRFKAEAVPIVRRALAKSEESLLPPVAEAPRRLDELAQRKILVELGGVRTPLGEPLRLPVFDVAEAKADRMYFTSQECLLLLAA